MGNENVQLADSLHSVAIRLLRSVRHVDRNSGLSPARLSALSVLVFAGPLTVGRLAAAEGVKSPTMTGIVNGLVEEGLAERRAASGDQRAVEVVVTAKGRRLFNAARKRRVAAVADLLRRLDNSELEQVRQATEALHGALASRHPRPSSPAQSCREPVGPSSRSGRRRAGPS